LRDFDEYILEGIVRKINPDKKRANSLISDSNKRNLFLNQILKFITITDDNANYVIEEIYDILIGLIRAKMLLSGYSASGNYAHEAEVSYLKNLNFKDYEINLINEIRQFRNGIKYYGKMYKKEEAEKSINFLNSTLPKLKKFFDFINN